MTAEAEALAQVLLDHHRSIGRRPEDRPEDPTHSLSNTRGYVKEQACHTLHVLWAGIFKRLPSGAMTMAGRQSTH
jgi:hypothetical protein